MKSIAIVDKNRTVVLPCLLDRTTDLVLLLYQKILVLILTLNKLPFRLNLGTDLVKLLQGANIPDSDFLAHLGQTACSLVLLQLDTEDRILIQSLRALVLNGNLYIILLTNNAQIKGILA